MSALIGNILVSQLRLFFSDFSLFGSVENDLHNIINQFSQCSQQEAFSQIKEALNKGVQSYFDQFTTASSEAKSILKSLFLCLIALYLSTVTLEETKRVVFTSIDELLSFYPEFHHLKLSERQKDLLELHHLLNFRNYLALLFRCTPSEGKKIQLLKAIGRIDGSFGDYHPGSGQKPETSYRCLVYYREGNHPIKHDAYLNIPGEKLSMRITDVHLKSPNALQKRKFNEIDQNLAEDGNKQPDERIAKQTLEQHRKLFERSNTKNLLDKNEMEAATKSPGKDSVFPLLPRWNSEHIDFDEEKDSQLIPYDGSFSQAIPEDLGFNDNIGLKKEKLIIE